MRIEIWTDIICPWCGLGDHRLKAALARFPHAAEVEVVHRSFQLDPAAAPDRVDAARAYLLRRGFPEAQIAAMTANIERLAAADGLVPYIVAENRVGNTSLAHELAAWATERGRGRAMWDRLFAVYFGQAYDIFTPASLAALAPSVGLDEAAALEALSSRRYQAQVLADGREASQLGASGVPFVVIDRRYGIAGAQATEVFTQALTQAWDARPG